MSLPLWLILALTAAASWAIVNVFDKWLIARQISSLWARLVFDAAIGLVTCLPIAVFCGIGRSPAIVSSMLVGVGVGIFNYLYYRALQFADVSATSAWLQTIPVFCCLWGFLFFGELFRPRVYAGIALVICGIFLLGVERGNPVKAWSKSSQGLLMSLLPAAFLLSCLYAVQKSLLQESNYWEVFFWGRIGGFLASASLCLLSRRVRREVRALLSSAPIRTIVAVGLVEWLNVLGILLLIAAYSTGTITLVTTAAAIQPVFVIALTLGLAAAGRKTFLTDSSLNPIVLVVRLLAIALQIVGIYILSGQ